MLVLGVSGGFLFSYENEYDLPERMFHDAAAVLVRGGEVIAAIEEERLNRIKHTNKAPINAMKYCLEQSGCSIEDVDKIAVCFNENTYNHSIRTGYLLNTEIREFHTIRQFVQRAVKEAFGKQIDSQKIEFVPHHASHAASTFEMSGFDRALVVTLDGQGDDDAGAVFSQDEEGNATMLYRMPFERSLGTFYVDVIMYLGYSQFDEYKVMGLAPYGNPDTYRRLFKKLYTLKPDGEYAIHFHYLSLLHDIVKPRRRGEPFTQTHKDIAAALQESLKTLVFHLIKHYKEKTQHTKLCLAGGVAHNCSLIGELAYSGLFEDIFVQPASHDAGAALGAALLVCKKSSPLTMKANRLEHVYWGTDVESHPIEHALMKWKDFVEFKLSDDVVSETATFLANGAVCGWVQSRSEFGPRALGNRSIIADPRPAANKDRINYMVKKREGYRPFAPSVLEEFAEKYFELPLSRKDYRFMNFILYVRPEYRNNLGAITHVDGTARVQTVSRDTNEKYWKLIHAFGELTDTYVLLNTSFNNNYEPIVDSSEDALACFLTTDIDYLVIGDYIVSKKEVSLDAKRRFFPSLPVHTALKQELRYTSWNEAETLYRVEANYSKKHSASLSANLMNLLRQADGLHTWGQLLDASHLPPDEQEILTGELMDVWQTRLVRVHPEPLDTTGPRMSLLKVGGYDVEQN